MITKKTEIFANMNSELKLNLLIDDVTDLSATKINEIVNSIVKAY
jgi:hypothetical protein